MATAGRIRPAAAAGLRDAIREAGGVEVFAIGDVEDGEVVAFTVVCRGTEDAVPALLQRPQPGQVVVHNHPSGDLRPSEADMALASHYGENGVGVVIVDSDLTRANWVVEPHVKRQVPVDLDEVRQFFDIGLKSALPGWEPRPGQLDMALAVAESLSGVRPLAVEAGTGTGKSLAYLVPAALWARDNSGRVAISTYTHALQSQLVASDLPLLAAGGIDVPTAVLLGRGNYPCRRRLGLVAAESDGGTFEALVAWSNAGRAVHRAALPFPVDTEAWERIASDSDRTLSVRCPEYARCHFYDARRDAAAARVVVVNHALLLTDLNVRRIADRGPLPHFDRIVLDEAHHLEDAATGALSSRLSHRAFERATRPLSDAPTRPGALARIAMLDVDNVARADAVAVAQECLSVAQVAVSETLATLGEVTSPTRWEGVPAEVGKGVRELAEDLTKLETALEVVLLDLPDVAPQHAEPILDARRALRRVSEHAALVRRFVDGGESGRVRWVGPATRRPEDLAALEDAPIDVGELLTDVLWRPKPQTVATSATLTVAGSFSFFSERHGVDPQTAVVPSPFDHATQALLGLPKDLPDPDAPDWYEVSGRTIVDAVTRSGGGAFVLATSFTAVRTYAERLRRDLPGLRVLAQGEAGRSVLLDRFRADPSSVLVGTDSFWEGVSVAGDGLRLVILPRVPFRMPDDPLRQARAERLQRRGIDPFRAMTLPEALLKLRQGYGRLIRTTTDRGVVLLLDRRIWDRSWGRLALAALPPARRVVGPYRQVAEAMSAFLAR